MVYYRKPYFTSLRHFMRARKTHRNTWSEFYDQVLPGPERSDSRQRLRRHTTRVPPDFCSLRSLAVRREPAKSGVSQVHTANTHKMHIRHTKTHIHPGKP